MKIGLPSALEAVDTPSGIPPSLVNKMDIVRREVIYFCVYLIQLGGSWKFERPVKSSKENGR